MGLCVGPLFSQPRIGPLLCRLLVDTHRVQGVAGAEGDRGSNNLVKKMGTRAGSRARLHGTNAR